MNQIIAVVISLSAVVALAAGGGVTYRSAATPPTTTLEQKGHALYLLNCAHCHGADATGDEGPDLHGVTRSDARITSLIKDGKKGEMPKFGSKLTDAEVKALVAFVRSLKD